MKNLANAVKRQFARLGTAMTASFVAVSTSHAAVDTAITTAISDGQTDMLTIVNLIIAMAATVYIARWILARFV